jgi:hypothetical protein
LLFHAIEDSLSLHLDARGWCDEVFVNLILPIRAQDAFLVLIATPNRNRYHESAAVEGRALVGTNSSATVDGRRARGSLGSLQRSYAPSRLVFRVMRKIQRPASTILQKCFYPLILRMSLNIKRDAQASGKIRTAPCDGVRITRCRERAWHEIVGDAIVYSSAFPSPIRAKKLSRASVSHDAFALARMVWLFVP